MTAALRLVIFFVEINLLLGLVWLVLMFALYLKEKLPRNISAAGLSRASRCLVVGALIIPVVASFLPREVLLKPSVQIWSSLDRRHAALSPVLVTRRGEAIPLARTLLAGTGWRSHLLPLILLFLILGATYGLARLAFAHRRLSRLLSQATPVRRIGRVVLHISDKVRVPFAFSRGWGRAYVVYPTSGLLDANGFRLGVRHELQHLRSRDTAWAQWLELIRALFYLSPMAHAVASLLAWLQEIACDEVLITCRNVSAQAYGRCLLEAAERAVGSHPLPAGTTGMAVAIAGSTLKRRVLMLLEYKKKDPAGWRGVRRSLMLRLFERWLLLGTFALMGSLAFASKSAIRDRRITMAQARQMAAGEGGAFNSASGASDSAFPLLVNAAVLDALNRYLGTPDGHRMIQHGLNRMPQYQELIDDYINEYGLPEELMAVPLAESAFQNAPPNKAPFFSAGLWQFVPGTARAYGLVVGNGVDERIDVDKETDAAMRYLDALYLRFQDWGLAIAGYNAGEHKVQQAIDQTGIRDPWKLEQMGKLNDYLADVVAAALILKNPSFAQ